MRRASKYNLKTHKRLITTLLPAYASDVGVLACLLASSAYVVSAAVTAVASLSPPLC